MKQAAVLAFVVLFAASMVHFFYAEDHCPVHCPTNGGQVGHDHQHHHDASICLCHWTSLMGPETDDLVRALSFEALDILAATGRPRAPMSADIAHPPKPSLV